MRLEGAGSDGGRVVSAAESMIGRIVGGGRGGGTSDGGGGPAVDGLVAVFARPGQGSGTQKRLGQQIVHVAIRHVRLAKVTRIGIAVRMGFAVRVEGAGGGVPRRAAERVGRLDSSGGGSVVVDGGGGVPLSSSRGRVVIVIVEVDGVNGRRSNRVAAADGGDDEDHGP